MASLPDYVRALIPLTPAVFHVMLALAEGPRHGYAIMQETEAMSAGGFRMGPATLYSTIQRLAGLDLIRETTGDAGDDTRRRYYELTPGGRRLLEMEVERMGKVVGLANVRMVPNA